MVTLLSAGQTVTPADDVLTKAWGEHHLLCTTYGSDVGLQVRVPGGTWVPVSYNGDAITLGAAGAMAEVRLIREYEYRAVTATAGSVVVIAPYTTKWNPSP